VLLMHRSVIEDGVLRGGCFETDYASLCAWRDWAQPDGDVHNFFAAAALRSADGAYLVGEMAPNTAAAGLAYFPCGTPEPDDIDARGRFDLCGNLRRELQEETGLSIDELDCEPGWSLVRDRGFVGFLKRVTAAEDAGALRSRIRRYLETESQPEFSDIHILRGPADLDTRIPGFVVAFLDAMWRQ
jgi:8-oxo-dGTP pyrophosphatase MutT (NUDIX family)